MFVRPAGVGLHTPPPPSCTYFLYPRCLHNLVWDLRHLHFHVHLQPCQILTVGQFRMCVQLYQGTLCSHARVSSCSCCYDGVTCVSTELCKDSTWGPEALQGEGSAGIPLKWPHTHTSPHLWVGGSQMVPSGIRVTMDCQSGFWLGLPTHRRTWEPGLVCSHT